jgi:hypothetical protein
MTHTQALEVKQVLLQIRDSIPPNLVDPIFNYYRTYIDPHAGKPCTCQPKYWNQMLLKLKDKVEVTLSSYGEEDKQEVGQGDTPKHTRKKRSRGTE